MTHPNPPIKGGNSYNRLVVILNYIRKDTKTKKRILTHVVRILLFSFTYLYATLHSIPSLYGRAGEGLTALHTHLATDTTPLRSAS